MIRLEGVDLRRRSPSSRGDAAALALRGLTFAIADGGFRWVTGPPAAGKSALLAVLAGRARPDAGRVSLLGVDPARDGETRRARLRRAVGIIDEERALLPHLSVLDNTALPLRVNGVASATARIDALEMLGWIGLGHAVDMRAGDLTPGERLLCVVARAVVGRPSLLLADEPAEGLGENEGSRIFQLLLEMNRLGATTVVATRSEWLRRSYDAPALVLDRGRLQGAA